MINRGIIFYTIDNCNSGNRTRAKRWKSIVLTTTPPMALKGNNPELLLTFRRVAVINCIKNDSTVYHSGYQNYNICTAVFIEDRTWSMLTLRPSYGKGRY